MDINKIAQIKPSEFAEEYIGARLNKYQKLILDNYNSKATYYIPARNSKRIIIFYKALHHLLKMKDDDVIMIMEQDDWKEMNREQFADYLTDKFWK